MSRKHNKLCAPFGRPGRDKLPAISFRNSGLQDAAISYVAFEQRADKKSVSRTPDRL
jgi:hypothetical protein